MMQWRAFQNFEESRVRAELSELRHDLDVCKTLAHHFLRTLKPIVGCFSYSVLTRQEDDGMVHNYVRQLEEAYQAAEVLRQVGGPTWNHLPKTAAWLANVQDRTRSVVRSSPLPGRSVSNLDRKLLTIELRHLWYAVREAERRIGPPVPPQAVC